MEFVLGPNREEMRHVQSVRHRVEAGAALLDEMVPGWREKVDLDRLDISETCHCIIGQVFEFPTGSRVDLTEQFTDALHELELRGSEDYLYGFESALGCDEYPLLDVAWMKELT